MRRSLVGAMAIGLLVFGYLAGSAHVLRQPSLAAADDCQTFPQTGFQACGDFLAYWRDHGALAQQGYPISPPFQEKSDTDGKTYTVQYFERAVFEAHPENQPPYTVLLSLAGSQKYKAKYPNGAPTGATPTPPVAGTGDAIGQTLVCKCNPHPGSAFSLTITDSKRVSTLGTHTASGVYVLIFARVTNTGKNPEYITNSGLSLLDSQGRRFGFAADAAFDASRQYGAKGISENIQPSIPTDMVFIFDIAPDATGVKVVPGSSG